MRSLHFAYNIEQLVISTLNNANTFTGALFT